MGKLRSLLSTINYFTYGLFYNTMKKYLILPLIIFALLLSSCFRGGESKTVNASEHGVSEGNSGEENSKALQALIDWAENSGKTIYIPAGEYEFAENGKQTIGSHCIKMRSGVSIVGDGEKTVLKPVGKSRYGLDMFYFNDYLDKGEALYLENCRFESFVIDASATSCEVYTSAGKGFMFNLFKNCHFKNITVKNTDATGFGVDCPIDSTITECVATGCGKAATEESSGASGFGIGFGYSAEESIYISDCKSVGNKKFGFFLEHQGRFNLEKYSAIPQKSFDVKNCEAEENLFGFGGIAAINTVYDGCASSGARRCGFFFENSFASEVKNCKSKGAKEACFSVVYGSHQEIFDEMKAICFSACEGEGSPVGVLTLCDGSKKPRVEDCIFREVEKEYVEQGYEFEIR